MTRKERISWLEMYSWHNLHEDTLAEIMGVIAAGTIAGSGIPDLLAENQRLREALAEAKSVIRIWHQMGVPEDDEQVWNIYNDVSPEMKRINAALNEQK